MISPPQTGQRDNYYIVRTTSIPSNATVSVTTDAEITMDAGMQLVLKQLDLPYREMSGWPGKIAMEEGGILHPDSHIKNQFYEAFVGNQTISVNLSIVSIHFALEEVDGSQRNQPLVVRVKNAEKPMYLKMNNDLHQPGDKYSQTVHIGVKISGKLENGKTANQVVYIFGVVEFTPEEFKRFNYLF